MELASTWPTARISEIADVVDYVANGSFASLKANVIYKDEPDYAVLVRLTDFNNGWDGPFVYVPEHSFKFLRKSSLAPGDIVVANVGAYAGTPFRAPKLNRPMTLGPNAVAVKTRKGFDSGFYFYFLSSQLGQGLLHNIIGGAAQPKFNKTEFRALEVPVPPLPVQRRIAGILSAYDDLIENNQRRIKILEEMARSLYREWFVHFRFPGHDKVKMVPSSLGPIPTGWQVTTFGELYDTSSGGTPSRKRPDYFKGGTIDWVKSQELLDRFILSSDERITEHALKESSAKLFPRNTVLIALYGATIGKLAILSREAATNQACCAVIPKREPFGREFAFLTLLLNRERIVGLRLGAAQQNISQVLLRNFDCLKPVGKLVQRFTEQTAPFFDGILNLQLKTKNLRDTRDLLLSRLLSGQVPLTS